MTGKITFTPEEAGPCYQRAGCQGRPLPTLHSRGTIWTCDECSREWVLVTWAQVNESYSVWRWLTERNRGGYDR